MNKTEAQRLWNALCGATCKPGTRASYDSVMYSEGNLYATDSYMIHRVHGLYDLRVNLIRIMHASEIVTASHGVRYNLERFFDVKLSDTLSNTYYDPKLFYKAMRPHYSFNDNAAIQLQSSTEKNGPLFIRSTHIDGDVVITIDTCLAGKKVR